MTEDVNSFILRVGSNKDLYNMTWEDVSDKVYETYGVALSADCCRKRCRRLLQIQANETTTPTSKVNEGFITEETDGQLSFGEVKYQDAQTEDDDRLIHSSYAQRTKFTDEEKARFNYLQARDERIQTNAMFRRLSREESLKDIARMAIDTIGDIRPLQIHTPSGFIEGKEAILLLGDWHYGVDFASNINTFNTDIARDRLQELKDKIIDKITYDGIKKLYVVNLGDLIAGNIHLQLRINSRIDVMTQTIQVSELLAEFIADLSTHTEIDYYSVLDNHSRIDPNKKDAIQLESLARITDWYISMRLGFPLHDNEFGPTIANFTMEDGTRVFCVHGDKDKPATIIDKLNGFTQAKADIICSAHLHHFAANESHNTLHIENGSLMGTDQYAYDLRLHSQPSQTLIVRDNGDTVVTKINLH